MPFIHRWLILAFVIGPSFCLYYTKSISSNRIVDLGDSDFLDEVLQANICAIASHREQRLCSPFGRFISLAGRRREGDQMEGEGPDEIMPDDYNCPFMLLEASGSEPRLPPCHLTVGVSTRWKRTDCWKKACVFWTSS